MMLTVSDITSVDKIIKEFGRDGIRGLFFFKTIKLQVQNELRKQGEFLRNEDMLNQVCAEAAKKLLLAGKEQPSKDEISEILHKLKQ